jgi:hypothetical protein
MQKPAWCLDLRVAAFEVLAPALGRSPFFRRSRTDSNNCASTAKRQRDSGSHRLRPNCIRTPLSGALGDLF